MCVCPAGVAVANLGDVVGCLHFMRLLLPLVGCVGGVGGVDAFTLRNTGPLNRAGVQGTSLARTLTDSSSPVKFGLQCQSLRSTEPRSYQRFQNQQKNGQGEPNNARKISSVLL